MTTSTTAAITPELAAMTNYQTTTGNGFAIFSKLNNENFYQWKDNMTTLLCGLNQYEIVEGKVTTPADPTVLAAFNLRKSRAYMEIALRIEPEWKQPISATTDPKTAWDTLNSTYGAGLDGIRDILLAQLTAMRWDPSVPIMVHQMRMEELRTKLKAAGHDLSEDTFLSYFFKFPPSRIRDFRIDCELYRAGGHCCGPSAED